MGKKILFLPIKGNSCGGVWFVNKTIGEELIKSLEIQKVRLRVHDNIARIEILKEDFKKTLDNEEIIDKIKKLGFKFVTLDLSGIKSGSFD